MSAEYNSRSDQSWFLSRSDFWTYRWCLLRMNQSFRHYWNGISEYPLKRIVNFKGLSVRPSIGYPLKSLVNQLFLGLLGQVHRALTFRQLAHLYLLDEHRKHFSWWVPLLNSEFPQLHITQCGLFDLWSVNSQPQPVHWYVFVSNIIHPGSVQISSGTSLFA